MLLTGNASQYMFVVNYMRWTAYVIYEPWVGRYVEKTEMCSWSPIKDIKVLAFWQMRWLCFSVKQMPGAWRWPRSDQDVACHNVIQTWGRFVKAIYKPKKMFRLCSEPIRFFFVKKLAHKFLFCKMPNLISNHSCVWAVRDLPRVIVCLMLSRLEPTYTYIEEAWCILFRIFPA
jgi:hypothetical protein